MTQDQNSARIVLPIGVSELCFCKYFNMQFFILLVNEKWHRQIAALMFLHVLILAGGTVADNNHIYS
jgi:hypothetical protein